MNQLVSILLQSARHRRCHQSFRSAGRGCMTRSPQAFPTASIHESSTSATDKNEHREQVPNGHHVNTEARSTYRKIQIDRSDLGPPGGRFHQNPLTPSDGTVTEAHTPLARLLARNIQLSGPMTIAEYMRQCLAHDNHGYYHRAQVLGSEGDFVTAPEVSQVFGELVGVWTILIMDKLPLQAPVELVELGPGRGTMMADMLRVITRLKKARLSTGIKVALIETSDSMRAKQREKLTTFINEGSIAVDWFRSIHEYKIHRESNGSQSCPIFLAQEFFDALPVHQFQYDSVRKRWMERLVDVNTVAGLRESSKPLLRHVLSNAKTKAELYLESPIYSDLLQVRLESQSLPCSASAGDPNPKRSEQWNELEISPESLATIELLCSMIRDSPGGAALVIDYGRAEIVERSVRAIRQHKFESILDHPGEADVTADVDFGALARAVKLWNTKSVPQGQPNARRILSYGPVTHAQFLGQLGIQDRFRILAKKAGNNREALEKLQHEYNRLMLDSEMGRIYKAFCLVPEGPSFRQVAGFTCGGEVAQS